MPESNESARDFAEFETICGHWAEDPARFHGAVIPPIYQNSLFTSPTCEAREIREGDTYDYTRIQNPTTEVVEAKIAALERGEQARCFGSGMGAISAAILSCVRTGDHVVAVKSAYGPTRQFLSDYLNRFQIDVTYVDGTVLEAFEEARRPNTTLFYLESPSSIVFSQQDLRAVVSIAKQHGIATICDNSWASPYFQNPLEMGVDIVVHSATKYLGGHSDIVAGVAVSSAAHMQKMTHNEGYLLGAILDPFASWLLLRGLRTLPLRMERTQQNALRIVRELMEHEAVERVYFPGIETDPQRELAQRQLRGVGGLLSFALKKQDKATQYRFVNALKYFGIGCSWGGFESLALAMHLPGWFFAAEGDGAPLIIRPGGLVDGDSREAKWVIRAYIGLENVNDLSADIQQALAMV